MKIAPTAMIHVHLVAQDGTVTVSMKNATDTKETLLHTYKEVNTDGYVALCSTAGGNFTIDNFAIQNLDGNELVNAAPVANSETKTVKAGETLAANVTATDADDTALTYELVNDGTADKGTLTFDAATGGYNFVAKADAKAGSVTFHLQGLRHRSLFGSRDDHHPSRGKAGGVFFDPDEHSDEQHSDQYPDEHSDFFGNGGTTTNKGCGGCGGSIAGGALASVFALAGIGFCFLRKKHTK
jgi:hypothetical protein